MPTVRDVYKIVAYFAQGQKLVLWLGKRVGDDHYSTSGLCPIYPGWERSIARWHKRWTHKGKPGKIRRWSAVQASFPTFVS
jgi:hypothetical protein